jgi:hypothetical protein
MSTDAKTDLTEPELLHLFLERRIAKGERKGSLDEVMAEYAKWREQVERVRQMVREAEESSALYGSKPLDFDAFWKELDLEMDERGIPE